MRTKEKVEFTPSSPYLIVAPGCNHTQSAVNNFTSLKTMPSNLNKDWLDEMVLSFGGGLGECCHLEWDGGVVI